MNDFPLGRIGWWWSEKKSRKFSVQEFSNVCRTYGFELVKIDLNHPLEEQGPFVAIVNKLTDVSLKAEKGDLQSKIICDAFQKYIDDHPEIVVIDSLTNIKKLTDRCIQYKYAANELSKKADAFIPAFVELTTTNVSENMSKLKTAGVDFPIANVGKVETMDQFLKFMTHKKMCIIFNEDGLKDVDPPCVAQKFINHNAVLFKLFTIGDKYFMIERPSLKNFTAGDKKTIFFNSNEISKPDSASELNELDDNDEQRTPYLWPEEEKMNHIVETLYKCLGLNLIGIDVIIENKTGHYGVVDINVFPGYVEVDRFFPLLCELIIKKMSLKAEGKDDVEFKPSLELISTPPRGHQKFNFDFFNCKERQSESIIPTTPPCFCCPISSDCLNGLHIKEKCSKTVQLTENRTNLPHFHSLDCAQDDSGIETSDSCDEKKEACHRTLRRFHCRVNTTTLSVDGSI